MLDHGLTAWCPAAFWSGHQEAVLFGQEEAGGDGIHADVWAVFLGHVHGQPLGEVGDGGFGGAVGGDARQGADGVHGGDVDDVALAALRHTAAEDLAGEDSAGHIQREDLLDGGFVQVEEGLGRGGGGPRLVAACRVDEDIDGAEGGRDLREGVFERGAVLHVAGEADGLVAFTLYRG